MAGVLSYCQPAEDKNHIKKYLPQGGTIVVVVVTVHFLLGPLRPPTTVHATLCV
jgi:hypothetical protein